MTAAFRFAAYYAAFYLTLGALMPFLPEWLRERGLSPEWIGLIVAAGQAGRTLLSPLGAMWADMQPKRRDPIILFSAAALVLFLLHIPARDPALLLVLSFLMNGAFLGQIPLIDSFAMRAARRGEIEFGPVRSVGSAAFILSNLAAGATLTGFGAESVLAWMAGGGVMLLAASARLPEGRRASHASSGPKWRGLGALLASPFALILAASALIQGSHGFYYAFSVVAWTDRGMPGPLIGGLWALGVAAEIVFLWASGRGWLGRLGPSTLMIAGGAAGVVRWGLTALSPPLWALAPLQMLHAASFAATYLGFIRYASDQVPDRYAATAQAINSALSGGLVMAAASAASGFLFERIGEAGFAAMMLPAALGLGAALLSLRYKRFPRLSEMD